jgi:metacaspase-1
MSWAFLEVMRENDGRMTYLDILRQTRGKLQGKYSQVPQLSVGDQFNLEVPFNF